MVGRHVDIMYVEPSEAMLAVAEQYGALPCKGVDIKYDIDPAL